MTTDRQDLEAIGFRKVGNWHLGDGDLHFALDRLSNAAPALYAFVIGADVMYVGKTVRTLKERMYGYEKGGGSQRTNIRVRNEIRQALRQGHTVDILGFHDPRTLRMGRFLLNLPAALEDDIIQTLNPHWNGAKSKTTGFSSVEMVLPEEGHSPAPSHEATTSATRGDSLREGSPTAPTFQVTVGQTYYRQGFFNVPIDHKDHFPDHDEEIEIRLTPLFARVNRTANPNGTPRIMGGTGLRDWFQKRAHTDYRVRVRVLGKGCIELALD